MAKGVAFPPEFRAEAVRMFRASGRSLTSVARELGEIKRSSQHLESEELRWIEEDDDKLIELCVHRCAHRAGRQVGAGNTSNGSGRRLLEDSPARKLPSPSACRQRSEAVCSVKLVAWPQSVKPRFPGATSPSTSARISRCFTPQAAAYVTSLDSWIARRPRSRANSGAMRRPVAVT